jgi:hypothetical protein
VLGVGGLPFESIELELPEGSLVALYSDGLVEATDNDPDHGIERLRRVLAARGRHLEDRCDQVLATLLPDTSGRRRGAGAGAHQGAARRPRARLGPAGRLGIVAEARGWPPRSLAQWGLATRVRHRTGRQRARHERIRYGAEPIQLRLIYDEVADLRGLGRQLHLAAPAPGPHLRRGRSRPAAGRPADHELGHPAHADRQDDLDRAGVTAGGWAVI